MATETVTPQSAASLDPDALYEVLDGQFVEKPPMSALESLIAARSASSGAPLAR